MILKEELSMKNLEKEYPILKEDRIRKMHKKNERRGILGWLGAMLEILLRIFIK